MENINMYIGIVGVFGAIISPIVTLIGLWFSHKINVKKAASEEKKTLGEAEKLEEEARELNIRNQLAQIGVYAVTIENLRKDVWEHTSKISLLENRLLETENERDVLKNENRSLRTQVRELQDKVQVLEDLRTNGNIE